MSTRRDTAVWRTFAVQGAKGVALARIDTGSTILDVYCSHIHARYVPTDMDDEYVAHRSLQLYELSKFVSATRCRLPGSASVLVGDLNTWHGNLGLEMLQCVTGMHDAYAITHPDTYLDAATHNVLDNVCVARTRWCCACGALTVPLHRVHQVPRDRSPSPTHRPRPVH